MWPIVTLGYLVNYLWDAGGCLQTGMGAAPLSWQEIKAWQEQSGLELQPWELRILKEASREYTSQLLVSHKPDCPPPGKIIEHDPKKVEKHIKSILRG